MSTRYPVRPNRIQSSTFAALFVTSLALSVLTPNAFADGGAQAPSQTPSDSDALKQISNRYKNVNNSLNSNSINESTRATNGSTDENCPVSENIDGKFTCSGTQAIMTTQMVTNVAGQTLGTQGVNTAGAIGMQNAMQQGTQSAAMKAEANAAKLSAESQIGVGTMNAAMGALQLYEAFQHKHNATILKSQVANGQIEVNQATGQASSTITDTNNIVNGHDKKLKNLNGYYQQKIQRQLNDAKTLESSGIAAYVNQGKAIEAQAYKQKRNSIADDVKSTANNAAGEQMKMYTKAMAQGLAATVQGVAQAGSGMMNMMAADQMSKAANNLSNVNGNTFTLSPGNVNPGQDNFGGSTAINPGSATDPAVAQDNGKLAGGGAPTITPPANPDPTNPSLPQGPLAGSFNAQMPKPAGGGGAGGGVGVGNTSEAKPETGNNAPKMARNGANTAYNQGGGGYVTGGVGADTKGPDLSFLANLLPKKADEAGKNSILDYGGRSPASMQPYSLLGRDVNLFQRISDTMTAKAKSGAVGS